MSEDVTPQGGVSEEQDEKDARQRRKLLAKTTAEVIDLLTNEDGFERLRAITDEEWSAAEAADGEGEVVEGEADAS